MKTMIAKRLAVCVTLQFAQTAFGAPEGAEISRPPTIDVKIEGITRGEETKSLELKKVGERIYGITPEGKKYALDESVAKLANSTALGTLARNEQGRFEVTSAESAVNSKFTKYKEDLQGKVNSELIDQIEKNVTDVEKLTEPLRKPLVDPGRGPASEDKPKVDYDELKDKLNAITGDSEKAYTQALDARDYQTATRMAVIWLTTRNEQKSYYGALDPDNYSPATYLNVVDTALASCKVIIDPGQTDPMKASGVLIGPKTVLTCAHDVEFGDDFRLDFSDRFGKVVARCPAKRIWRGKSRDDVESRLDYAILEITDWDADDPIPGDRKPVPLVDARASLDSPVYAIGHPGGKELLVHDYARVVCPHELKESDRGSFMIRLQADLIRANKIAGTTMETAVAAEEAFKRRYIKKGDSFFYRDPYNDSKIPVFGADTDTFHGDSGGPVILRKTGGIIGILIEGMPDNDFFANATILSHERCLPIKAVIDQLRPTKPSEAEPPRSILPGWPTAFGVKIVFPN
ncbi:trypsin-like serine peptidase [Luteolibacter soli]|uniref:Serine protease n=1 Tax=Luteolibacter soli TaxID=3135280 RepID=A0ABU9AV55_9BACT